MRKLGKLNSKNIGLLFALGFLIVSIAFIAVYTPQQRGIQPRAATTNFPTQSSDGRVRFSSTNWPPDPSGKCFENISMEATDVGQFTVGDPITYKASRTYLVFNTTSITSYAIVNSVTLRLRLLYDKSTTDFDVRVYDYDWATPLSCSAWNPPGAYVAARNTSAISGGLFDIELTPSVINKGSTTKLALTSSREENNNTPSVPEWISFYTGNSATPSELIVNYTVPPPVPDIKANGSNGPITIGYNSSASISWGSSYATSCSVSPTGWTGTSSTGKSTGNLTKKTTYTLSCTGAGGSDSDLVTVNVSAPPDDGDGDNPPPDDGNGNGTTPSDGNTLPPPPPDGKVDPTILNYLKLKINVPFLLGKMKIPVVIGGFTKEIEVSPGSHEYKIDVRGAKFKLGKEVTVVAGGNKTLTKRLKVKTKAPTMPVKAGNLDLGDINEDNSVNEQDALLLLKAIASQATKGDLNLDKVANSLDWAILFVNYGKRGSK